MGAPTSTPNASKAQKTRREQKKQETQSSLQKSDNEPVTIIEHTETIEQAAMPIDIDSIEETYIPAQSEEKMEGVEENSTKTQPKAFAKKKRDNKRDQHITQAKENSQRKPRASEKQPDPTSLRRIPIPPHRRTPLKADWMEIYEPIVESLKCAIRYDERKGMVEIKALPETDMAGAVQKAVDFVKAYATGFAPKDAIALVRLDDLYVDTFEIKDVKTLHGDHLSRAIGRLVGRDGKTRFAIENASKTRVVIAGTKIHILGSFQNIRVARDALVALILGSPPGKVYSQMRIVANRLKERF